MNIIRELLANRRLIWKLSKNDFKTKYAGSYFGIIWAFVQPIVTILIYIFVFQFGFRAQPIATDIPYALWLVAGIVPWFFFSEALVNATNCLLEYSYLVKKVVFKISILPIVKVSSSLFVHVFFVGLAIIIYLLFGVVPQPQLIQIVYYTFCAVCLVIAISYLTCAIVPFFRDFSSIINIIMQVLMWACPILWSSETTQVPAIVENILGLNPLGYVIEGYRDSFIYGV